MKNINNIEKRLIIPITPPKREHCSLERYNYRNPYKQKQNEIQLYSPEVIQLLASLQNEKQTLKKIDKQITNLLNDDPNIFIRLFKKVRPKNITNVVNDIEYHLAKKLEDIQIVLGEVGNLALAKKDELQSLERDVEIAEKEGWGIMQLRDYLIEKSEIPYYDQTKAFLERELEFLTPEEANSKKGKLLQILKQNINVGYNLVNLLGKVAIEGVELFEESLTQYYGFINIAGPLIVLRESCNTFLDTQKAAFTARSASEAYLNRTIDALSLAVDGIKLLRQYQIASDDFSNIIKTKTEQLESKLNSLLSYKNDRE